MNCYGFLNWRSQFWDQPLSILCVHPEGHDFGLDPTWRWTEWQRYLSRSSSSWHGAPGKDSPRLFWSGSVMNESTKYRSTSSAALQKCIWSPSIFNLTVLVLRISWNHSFFKEFFAQIESSKKTFFLRKGLCCELVLPTVCRLREVLPDPRVGAKGALYPRSCWRAGATRHECAMLK